MRARPPPAHACTPMRAQPRRSRTQLLTLGSRAWEAAGARCKWVGYLTTQLPNYLTTYLACSARPDLPCLYGLLWLHRALHPPTDDDYGDPTCPMGGAWPLNAQQNYICMNPPQVGGLCMHLLWGPYACAEPAPSTWASTTSA